MQTPKKPIKKPVAKKNTGKSDPYRASVDKMLTGKYQGTRPRMEDAFTGKGIFYKKGGSKKYKDGGDVGQPLRPSDFEKRQAKKIAKAQTRAAVAEIEGEGTVAQKRDNRASRVSTMAGTARAKTPKSVSTSTSTTDNRNSGNTTNTTNSGAGATGGQGGSGGRSGSSSGVDASRKSSVRQSQDNSRTTNVKNTSNTNVRQSQNNSRNSSKSIDILKDNSNRPTTTTTNYTDKSKKSTVDQSRKNYQVGKGNTSTKNSNYKKGGTTKMKMGGAKPKAMYGMSMKPTMMKKGGVKKK